MIFLLPFRVSIQFRHIPSSLAVAICIFLALKTVSVIDICYSIAANLPFPTSLGNLLLTNVETTRAAAAVVTGLNYKLYPSRLALKLKVTAVLLYCIGRDSTGTNANFYSKAIHRIFFIWMQLLEYSLLFLWLNCTGRTMRTLSKGMEIASLQQRSQIFMWIFMNRPLRILTLGLKQLQFLTGARWSS